MHSNRKRTYRLLIVCLLAGRGVASTGEEGVSTQGIHPLQGVYLLWGEGASTGVGASSGGGCIHWRGGASRGGASGGCIHEGAYLLPYSVCGQ